MKSRIFIFIVLCRLLNAQDNPMALLDAGERALTNGNYVLAGQQMDRALLSAGNVVLPSSDLRRVLLRSMEVAVLNAQFGKAEKLAPQFQQIGGLEAAEIVRMKIVVASCAVARGDLGAAAEAADSAVVLARQQLDATNDWAVNALAELAEVRRLEGNFADARQLAAGVAKATEGRAGSLALSYSALAIPSEIALTEGRMADAGRFAEASRSARALPLHPTSLMLRELLARIAVEEGRVPDAAALMDGIGDNARRQLGQNHPFVLESLLTEAAILSRRNAWQEADVRLAAASSLIESASADNELKLRLLELRVAALLGSHRVAEADTVLGKAVPMAASAGAASLAMATVANLRGAVATEQRKFDNAEKSLREAAAILSGQTEDRQPVRMANLFYTGLLYDNWGDGERAQASLAKWIDLRGAAAQDEPEAVALSILGRNALRQRQPALAVTLISASIAIRNDIGGISPGELGREYNSLGVASRQSGNLDAAIAAFLRAKELKGAADTYDPDLNTSLSESLLAAGRGLDALPYLENRLRLVSQGDLNTNDALSLADQISRLQLAAGRFQDAERLLRQLYEAGLSGRGPGAKDRFSLLQRLADAGARLDHYEEASAYLDEMAHMRLLTKKWPEAEQFARRAAEIAQKAPSSSPSLASATNVLAETRLAQGAPDDAESLYLQASEAPGATQRTRAISLNGQGEIALAKKQWAQAGELLNEALKAAADSDLVGSGVEAAIVANLASAQKSEGHGDRANELYSRFLTLEPMSHPPQDPPLLNQLNELAGFYSLQSGRADDVLDVYNRVLRSSQLVFGEQSDEFALSLYDLAEFQRNRKNPDEAIPLYERSSKLYEDLYGLQSDQVLNVRSSMAAAYRSAGKTNAAIELIEPLVRTPDKSNLFQVNLIGQLGALYAEAGDNAAAVASYRSLVDIFENQSPAYLNSKWRGAMEGLIDATLSQGRATDAASLVRNAQDRIRHSAPRADTAAEVHLLRAYAAALRKNGNRKLADQVDEKATQVEQHLSGK